VAAVAATLAVLGCGLAIAAVADLGPFGDPAESGLAAIPVAAPCAAEGESPPEPASDGGPLIPRRPDGRLPIGFNDTAYLAGQATPAQSASMQRRAGSSVWRGVAEWKAIERTPGRYDFSSSDGFYCAALAAGLAPLIVITSAPAWAAEPAGPCPLRRCARPPGPAHDDDLRSFAAAVTARYPEAIGIEAWNEPNLHLFWAAPDPARYAEVLSAIREGVASVDPSMPVLMGGLSDVPAGDPGGADVPLPAFLGAALDAGAGDRVDAFGIHLYPRVTGADGGLPPRIRGLAQARSVLAHHGEGGARIWVTEAGVPAAGGVSRRAQARALTSLYGRLDVAPDVDAVLFHTLVEPSALIVGGRGYGWVAQRDSAGEFRPYPVYCAFARLLAEPVDCGKPL
jgi:hypothetical protein